MNREDATTKYPSFLVLAIDLGTELEKRTDAESLALRLDVQQFQDTFFGWQQNRPASTQKVLVEFMSLSRRVREHLLRVPAVR